MTAEIAEKAHDMAQQALQGVAEVRQKQASHEDICSFRYGEITTTMAELKSDIRTMFGRHMSVMVFIVILLLGAVGTLGGYIYVTADDRLEALENGNE